MTIFTKPSTVNEVWASTGITSAPTNLKIAQGWVVEIPPYQAFNWSQNRTDSFIAHVNQHGISRWDNTTQYYAGRSYTQGSDGIIYFAVATNTNIDPANPLNSATWMRAFEPFGSVAVVQSQLNTLQASYNTLANIANYPQARTNLSVWSRSEADTRYAFKAGSASQMFNVATATNPEHAVPLGQISSLLQGASTTQSGVTRLATNIEQEQGSLNSVASTPASSEATYLKKSQNLNDVPNKTLARSNMGLGNSATLNTGTTAGTVAAGDDSRIVNAVPNTRQVIAGNGLVGGGALSGNVTVTMGTPLTLNTGSANQVTATGHSHQIDLASFFDQSLLGNGYYVLPGGLIVQWMRVTESTSGTDFKSFPIPFPNNVFNIIGTPIIASSSGQETSAAGCIVRYFNNTGVVFSCGVAFNNGTEGFILAIGN